MNGADKKLADLKETRDQLTKDTAAAEERVRTLREQRKVKVEDAKKLGVTNVKDLPAAIENAESEAERLLNEIEAEIPEEYRSDES